MSSINYYPWIFFQDATEELSESALAERNFYVETYYESAISAKVSRAVNYGEKAKVYYHEHQNLAAIQTYHQQTFGAIPFVLLERLPKAAMLYKYDETATLVGLESIGFDAQGREITNAMFTADYQMTQYTESHYDDTEADRPSLEKTFYPKVWHMEEDDDLW